MGEELYAHVTDPSGLGIPCRVYAPVGEHEDLLPYLVRRLLENGSNTSFVNRIVNENEPIDAIIADPVRAVDALERGRARADPAARRHLPAGAQELAGDAPGEWRGMPRDGGAHGARVAPALGRSAAGRWRRAPGRDH